MTKRSTQLLETCVEALVLSYRLNVHADAFELVCESWALDAGATRAFAKISFTGVAEFESNVRLVARTAVSGLDVERTRLRGLVVD